MLAIVVPYFKLKFFDKTLKSLANQANKDFTVYIGNDASLENPEELIAEYSSILNIKYIRFEENLGSVSLVNQWKRCIEMTKNEKWIMLLGDDDVLNENTVEVWYKEFKDFNLKSNVIRFSTQLINEKDEVTSKIFTHPKWETSIDSFFRKFNKQTRSSLSEYIFSKESYEKFGFFNFNLGWHSDDLAWLDFSDGKPIYAIGDTTVFIRFTESSISGKEDNLNLKREASIKFYESLVRNKFLIFSKNQKLDIIKKYAFLKRSQRPFKLADWINLSLYYLRYFQLKSFKQFIKSFINYYF